MSIQLFNISLPDDAEHVIEGLNAFLASHKIVSVSHRGYERDGVPYELFVVDYIHGGASEGGRQVSSAGGERKGSIDYRKVLTADDFQVYLKLTRLRKKLAEEGGVELFMVYTNAQLAAMAEKRPRSLAALEKLDGIGEGKMQKYGKQTLDLLLTLPEKSGVQEEHGNGSAASDENVKEAEGASDASGGRTV